jgi:membrane fusion protein (multidrug efflux system)
VFQLDPRPLQTAYDQGQASLNQAKLQIAALKATYSQRLADLKAAQDNFTYLQGEATRQKALVAAGVATGAQAAQAASQAEQARSQVDAARAQVANALADLGGDANLPDDARPNVRQAQAGLANATLNLSYVDVHAPQDGVVTKVEQLQVGDFVTAATPVFSLISNDFWVEAEFKENQLEYMRPGEAATIKLDAYPNERFRARVETISPGTGSAFSLLPPENATGNWVKVTQRVPVRIVFTPLPSVPLASGLSASVRVDTAHRHHMFGAPTPVAATAGNGG